METHCSISSKLEAGGKEYKLQIELEKQEGCLLKSQTKPKGK